MVSSSSPSSPPSHSQILFAEARGLFIPNGFDKLDHYDPFVVPKEYIDSTPASASPTSQYDDQLLSFVTHPSNILVDDEAYFRLEDYLSQSPDAFESQRSFDEKKDHVNLNTEVPAPKPAVVTPATSMAILDGLQIRVIGAPDKSRVETQTRLCIQLLAANGNKVTHWPYLKLPERLLARPRLKRAAAQRSYVFPPKEASNDPNANHPTLYLDAKVICASRPEESVKVCQGCIQRERKRAESSKNDHRILIDATPEQDRILLFNCGPVVNFSSGDAILPARIACYCRHHNEKVGFRVQFSLKNYHGNVVATGVSTPILITDDHKSSRQKGRKRSRSDTDDCGSTANSRRGSLSPAAIKQEAIAPFLLPTPSEERWPSSLSDNDNDDNDTVVQSKQSLQGSTFPPLTPPPSASRCISPDALVTSPTPLPHSTSMPQLERLIPAQGSTYGGAEVTVLGSGFHRGLTCVFGGHQATTVYWSPNTLVCILPPAITPGPVVVSFKEHSLVLQGQDVLLFTYYNSDEQDLLELALQVVGIKMTGKLHDAKHIAMRIVQDGTSIGTDEQTVVPFGVKQIG